MKTFLSSMAHLSIKLLLLRELDAAVQAWQRDFMSHADPTQPQTSLARSTDGYPIEIPLQKSRDIHQLAYACPVALKLSAHCSMDAIAIAHDLIKQLSSYSNYTTTAPPQSFHSIVWQHFILNSTSNEWIYLRLDNIGLSVWLQHMIEISGIVTEKDSAAKAQSLELPADFPSVDFPSAADQAHRSGNKPPDLAPETAPDVWMAQYAHARCCGLLRLGERLGLVQLTPPFNPSTAELSHAIQADEQHRTKSMKSRQPPLGPPATDVQFNSVDANTQSYGSKSTNPEAFWPKSKLESGSRLGGLQHPNPIPWLTAEQQVCLRHPTEHRLITSLVNLTDMCADGEGKLTPQQQIFWLSRLAQELEAFDGACRIAGETAQRQPELSQARLGLVKILQWVLNGLLHNLGLVAPVEL
jgi:hypothetical protein